jgi:hypothetical protein
VLHQNVSLSGSQIKLCYALVLWYDIVGPLDCCRGSRLDGKSKDDNREENDNSLKNELYTGLDSRNINACPRSKFYRFAWLAHSKKCCYIDTEPTPMLPSTSLTKTLNCSSICPGHRQAIYRVLRSRSPRTWHRLAENRNPTSPEIQDGVSKWQMPGESGFVQVGLQLCKPSINAFMLTMISFSFRRITTLVLWPATEPDYCPCDRYGAVIMTGTHPHGGRRENVLVNRVALYPRK